MKHLRTSIGNGDSESTNAVRKILLQLCRIILGEGFAVGEQNDVYLGYVAVTAAFLEDISLFEKAREKTCKFWRDDSWFTLGELIDRNVPSISEKE